MERGPRMVAVGITWITCTPYGAGMLIGRWQVLNRIVARYLVIASCVGWTALLVVVCGVLFRHEHGGIVAAVIAAPFVGLAFWVPRSGGGGGEDPPDEPVDEPPPSGDTIDWDEFERARKDWERLPEPV